MGQSDNNVRGGTTRTCDPLLGVAQWQTGDLPPSANHEPETQGRAFVGYRRGADSDVDGGEGQDRVLLYTDRERAIGVLADGVSQSFYGQIAAQHVMVGIAEFLLTETAMDASEAYRNAIKARLREIAVRANIDVQAKQFRPDISERSRALLEEDRLNGSQSVFGAFVYYRKARRLVVCQIGDVRIRIFDERGNQALFPCTESGRFSTAQTADPQDKSLDRDLNFQAFDDVYGVLVHSDGVDDSWGERPSCLEDTDDKRDLITAAMNSWARKDDVSLAGVFTLPVLVRCEGNPLPQPPANQGAHGDGTEDKSSVSKDKFQQQLPTNAPRLTQFTPPVQVETKVENTQIRDPVPYYITPNRPEPELSEPPVQPRRPAKVGLNQNQQVAIAGGVLVVMMILSFAAGRMTSSGGTSKPPETGNNHHSGSTHTNASSAPILDSLKQCQEKVLKLEKKHFVEKGSSDDPDGITAAQLKKQLEWLDVQLGAIVDGTDKPADPKPTTKNKDPRDSGQD